MSDASLELARRDWASASPKSSTFKEGIPLDLRYGEPSGRGPLEVEGQFHRLDTVHAKPPRLDSALATQAD
jgi:hypothetical protein